MNSSHACLLAACEFMIQLTLEDTPSTLTLHSHTAFSVHSNVHTKKLQEVVQPSFGTVQNHPQMMSDT